MQVQTWYRAGLQRLREAGFDPPAAQVAARLLLDHTVGVAHAHLLAPFRELDASEVDKLQAQLAQAAARRPIPYIVGQRHFFGRIFRVDKRALIPRPETELLVETALAQCRGVTAPRLLDLGTGSGCIAITLALELPHSTVTATDVSPAALALAQENAAALGVKVNFLPGLPGDWSSPAAAIAPLHGIVSNPPYIPANEITRLQPEIRDFEPHRALDGGPDGLDDYRAIASQCTVLLCPGGFIALELGAGQYDAVREIFESAGWRVSPPVYDLASIPRVLLAHSPSASILLN